MRANPATNRKQNRVDFLSGIGVENIQRRLFYLTSRWVTRAQQVPAFRAAVSLDPAHCAGLVGFELSGKEYEPVDDVLDEHHVLIGGTEPYAGFFGIPENRPRGLFCQIRAFTPRPPMWTGMLLKLRRGPYEVGSAITRNGLTISGRTSRNDSDDRDVFKQAA